MNEKEKKERIIAIAQIFYGGLLACNTMGVIKHMEEFEKLSRELMELEKE